jgi:hypothetical protein
MLQIVEVISISVSSRKPILTWKLLDARAVLCRGGKALRLTVDHKANDPDEVWMQGMIQLSFFEVFLDSENS